MALAKRELAAPCPAAAYSEIAANLVEFGLFCREPAFKLFHCACIAWYSCMAF